MISIRDMRCDNRFWALPCIRDGNVIGPLHHGCPDCAIERNADHETVAMRLLGNSVRRLNRKGQLIVFDPVSEKTLSGSAIASIVANGPALQLGLHPSWWASLDDELDIACIDTPVAHCVCCAAKGAVPVSRKNVNTIVNKLSRLNDDHLLLVWDPVSRRLLSGAAIEHVCANGDAIQIGLSLDWAGIVDHGLDIQSENAPAAEPAAII